MSLARIRKPTLINDCMPPVIANVATQSVAGGVKITWTMDEFATSEVRYGTSPGAYTQTASDPLYEKAHSLTLTGLTAGRTYYFIVRGADRSGNQAQSGEYQVKAQTKRYLPLIRHAASPNRAFSQRGICQRPLPGTAPSQAV